MLFNLNEFEKQKESNVLFEAFHAVVYVLCCVFSSVAVNFSKLFGHCDKSNVSVSFCRWLNSRHGSLEMEKH